MKHLAAAVLLMIVSSGYVYAEEIEKEADEQRGIQIAGSVICRDVDGFFVSQYQIGIMPSMIFNERVIVSVPVLYTYQDHADSAWMLDSSANIAYRPGGGGLLVGMSVLQNVFLFGIPEAEDDHAVMHEITLGYTFYAGNMLMITPFLIVRDPFQRYQEEMEHIQRYFPSYGRIGLGICIGAIAADM